MGEQVGIPLWCQDEAGPYQTIPQPGSDWHLGGKPTLQPHEYMRDGTAKLLTLFRPATGELRAKGVEQVTNAVLHPWLKEQLLEILAQQEKEHPFSLQTPETPHFIWTHWYKWWWSYEWPMPCPRLRLILVWDNLAGHLSYEMVRWLLRQGILPLYTPLGGSWLNMAESVQRIIVRRALAGQHPKTASEIITWLEETVTGWNQHPTPFVWGGKRKKRRERARLRRLGGSGAALTNGYSIVA
jgi:DDE superfamily endonuclease